MNKAKVPNSESIPAFDYLTGYRAHRGEFLAAVERVLESGSLILGEELSSFESEFAQFVGAQAAVGVSSGTDALVIALRALEIKAGDEVITTANGPVPTAAAIRAVGATPRFVDIDPITLQISVSAVEAALSHCTRCILPVHLYGSPAPVEQLVELCRVRQLKMVEDCAQAHGTYLNGRHVGTFGEIGCFSFYPTKNLGGFGDAGMCITNHRQLSAKMTELRCYGFRTDRVALSDGLNCRLDEIQAACLRVRLKYLPGLLQKRRKHAEAYTQRLSGLGIALPSLVPGGAHSWHQFVIQVREREKWCAWFQQHRIGYGIHYRYPVHLMPAYQEYSAGLPSLPATELACDQVLSLPIFPELRASDLERIGHVIQAGKLCGLD